MSESRQVRRARERHETRQPKLRAGNPSGNRALRRAKRPDDSKLIIRPTGLNAVRSCKRTRRDYRIRQQLRPARGAVHPRKISAYRFFGMRAVAFIFAIAAKRAEERRAAA